MLIVDDTGNICMAQIAALAPWFSIDTQAQKLDDPRTFNQLCQVIQINQLNTSYLAKL